LIGLLGELVTLSSTGARTHQGGDGSRSGSSPHPRVVESPKRRRQTRQIGSQRIDGVSVGKRDDGVAAKASTATRWRLPAKDENVLDRRCKKDVWKKRRRSQHGATRWHPLLEAARSIDMADKRDNDSSNGRQGSDGRGGSPKPFGLPDSVGSSVQPFKGWRPWLLLMLVIMLLPSLMRWLGGGEPVVEIPYSTFRNHLQAGEVVSVTVKGDAIRGELRQQASAAGTKTASGETAQPPKKENAPAPGSEKPANAKNTKNVNSEHFRTRIPAFGDEALMPLLAKQGVEVNVEENKTFSWWLILVNLAPFALLIGLGWLLMSRMRGQGQRIFDIGRSRARKYDRSHERTTFDDVAGAEGAKRELEEFVAFLRAPDRFRRLGGSPPKGVLLVGPPGTGKTLLARATAGEANVPFFSITGSDFVEMFVGVGASRVRNLFADARKTAPSIVFIDELDSIGRHRGAGLGGGHDEREQTLNQLLSEMDGFEPNTGVILMAATNRPDVLDPALLRPGRFDRRITVDLVGQRARRDVLRIHARGKPLADDVDLDEVARATPGFSGADLANLLNEAALLAARRDKQQIEGQDVEDARDKVVMGLRREGIDLTDRERRLIAYHEAGHAVVAATLPHTDPVHKVTVVPRGRAMGATHQLPERDHFIADQEELRERVVVMLGGRASERLVFETATSGAENDLHHAVGLARKMVLAWGMSESLADLALDGERGPIFLGEQISQGRPYSEQTAREVDEQVAQIVRAAAEEARAILTEHRPALDRIVEELLAAEELTGDRVGELLAEEKANERS
jgi:cell division protease FtsH